MSDINKIVDNDSPLYENFECRDSCHCPTKAPRPTCPPHHTTPRPTTPKPTTPKPTTPKPTTPAPTTSPCSCCFADEKPVNYSNCELTKTEHLNNITLDCTGRLLDVNVTLTNVCPNKFANVAVLVFEGAKLLSIKVRRLFTGNGTACIPSLNAGKFCFVFDDDPCPQARTFTVRIVANYIEI